MKNLEFNQMEQVEGGITNRDCLVRGAGFTLAVLGGFFFPPLFAAAFVIAVTSADCY